MPNVEDGSAASLRQIIEVAHKIRDLVTSEGGAQTSATTPSLRLAPPSSTFPPPCDITQQLLDMGLPQPQCDQLQSTFASKINQLQASLQVNLEHAWSELCQTPKHDDLPSPAETAHKLQHTHLVLYQRKVEQVKLDILNYVKSRFQDQIRSAHDPAAKQKKSKPFFNYHYVPLLEHYFAENPLPTHADKNFLAKKCGMTFRQIHVWFQNRRNRTRKEGQVFKRKPQHELGKLPLDTLIAKMPHSIIPEDLRVPYVDSDASEYEWQYESSEDDASGWTEKYPRDPKATDVLDIPAPPYAYPTFYPPSKEEEPYPLEHNFPPPQWDRHPAKAPAKQPPAVDIEEFIKLFEQMSVKEGPRRRWRKKLPQNPRKPTKPKRTSTPPPKPDRSAATIAITVKPPAAPLPALIPPSLIPKPTSRLFLLPKPTVPTPTSRKRPHTSVEPESRSRTTPAPQCDDTTTPSSPAQESAVPAPAPRKRPRVSPNPESSTTAAVPPPPPQPEVAKEASPPTQNPTTPSPPAQKPAVPAPASRKRPRVSPDPESSSTTVAPPQPKAAKITSPPTQNSSVPAPASRKRSRASADSGSPSTTHAPPQTNAAKQPLPAKKQSSRQAPSQRKAAPLPKRVPNNTSIAHTPAPPITTVPPPLDYSSSSSSFSSSPESGSSSSKRLRLSSDSSTASEVETPEPYLLPLPPNVQPPVISIADFDFTSSSTLNDLFNDSPLHSLQAEGLQLDLPSNPYYGGEEVNKFNALNFDIAQFIMS